MDTITVLLEGMRVFLGFLNLLFVPGFVITLVYFPRLDEIGIVQRLVYSTVLSIGSVIALVLFMDVFLGVDTTPGNISIGIGAFSALMLVVWLCELWYLKSRFKKRLEPRVSADYEELQKFYSREINAAKDQFRQDTRTRVVYHESRQSGLNHVDHSYLMDIGEEIDIQQVAENRLKVTDTVIVQPPYPKTRYFELAMREYNADGQSLVDDLQIYPVLVTKNPDRKFLNFIIKQGTTHITERIYKKTSTTEVQWVYSRDFHLFGITHADDTLAMMVDRIMGKLDEIAISIKNGVHIISPIDGQRMLREAFDVVMEKPRDTMARPMQVPGRANVVTGELWELPKRPEVTAGVGGAPQETRPEIQPVVQTREIPKRPNVPEGELWEIYKRPEVPADGAPGEKRPEIQPLIQPKKIPKRTQIQPLTQPKEILRHPEQKLGVEPIRKLQKEIVRDMDMFHITPDSFSKSKKNIENIIIPKKSDVDKKLADVEEEVKDLDWLNE